MAARGILINYTAAELAELRTACKAALLAFLKNKSYTLPGGLQVTRADEEYVKSMMEEINYAELKQSGTLRTTKYADFRQR